MQTDCSIIVVNLNQNFSYNRLKVTWVRHLRRLSLVAERRLLAWYLWRTTIVILRLLLLLLHVICLRWWLLHVLCAWLRLLGAAKGRRRVLLHAWW